MGRVTSGADMAIDQAVQFLTTSLLVTDTLNWTTIRTIGLYVDDSPQVVFAWGDCAWSHSIVDAKASFRITVDDGTTTYTMQRRTDLAGARVAGDRVPVAFGGGYNVKVAFPLLLRNRIITVTFAVKPTTAGTLTVFSDAVDTPHCYGFISGDVSDA